MIRNLLKNQKFRTKLHHLWSATLLLISIFIISMAILLILIRASTPLLAKHHQEIQNWLSHKLKHPILIGSLQAGWQGFEPVIKISNVTIESNTSQPLMHIGNFSIGFRIFKTLFSRHLSIGLIAFQNSHLRIDQKSNGVTLIFSEGTQPIVALSNTRTDKGAFLKDLFSIKKIYLSQINVVWERADKRTIKFKNTQLQINNQEKQHQIWGTAQFEKANNANIAFVVNLTGNIINRTSLNGNIFIEGQKLDLNKWMPLVKFKNLTLNNGYVSGKSWLTLTSGKLTNVQSVFKVNDVSLKNLSTLQLLKFKEVSANMNWQKLSKGWQLTVDNFFIPKFFSKGVKLYLKSNNIGDESYKTGYINYLPLSVIHALIEFSNIKNTQQFFLNNRLTGTIQNIYGVYNNPTNYLLKFSAKDLAFTNLTKKVSLANLNAYVYILPDMGSLEIKSHQLILHNEYLKKSNINFKPFDSTVYWYRTAKQVSIYSPQMNIGDSNIEINSNLRLFIPLADPKDADINLNLKTALLKLNQLKFYLPKKVGPRHHLFDFLNNAFKKGTVQAQIEFSGKLTALSQSLQNNNGDPKIRMFAHLKNVDLHYKAGWPDIKDINGNLYLLNTQLAIQAHSAEMCGTNLENINAVIPNILNNVEPKIFIASKINGTLQQAKNFIDDSPLKNTLGKKIADLTFVGPMQLRLRLDVPLKHNTFKTKAQGILQMEGADISLPHIGLSFHQVYGNLGFTDHTISAENIHGTFLSEPVNATIQTYKPNTKKSMIEFKFRGKLNIKSLKRKFPNKFLNPLIGTTHYQAQLRLYNHNNNIPNTLIIRSNLIGIESGFPYPFNKIRENPESFYAQLTFNGSEPIKLSATLGDKISFESQFRKKNNIFSFYNGNLHFGKSKAIEQIQTGLLINGYLQHFKWVNWRPYFIERPSSQQPNFIRLVDLKLNEADIYNYLFIRTDIQLTKENTSWVLFVSGPNISGKIFLPIKNDNSIRANLSRLYLDQDNVALKKEKSHINPASLPNFNVSVEDFRIGDKVFGKVILRTKKIKDGLELTHFSSNTGSYDFRIHGHWIQKEKEQSSEISGELKAASITTLLAKFGLSTSIDAQNIVTKFQLSWPDNIFSPSLRTIHGNLSLASGSGSINNVGDKANSELATGKIITFLSVENLQKQILTNFSSLNSKGYQFESIDGLFSIEDGSAWTSNAKINGIIASIIFTGRIGFVAKDFNLFTQITPHVTSSIPIIATIAGGPIIGVATYIVNKIFSPSVNQMVARYYQLTGSWSKPKISQVHVSSNQVKTANRFEYF